MFSAYGFTDPSDVRRSAKTGNQGGTDQQLFFRGSNGDSEKRVVSVF